MGVVSLGIFSVEFKSRSESHDVQLVYQERIQKETSTVCGRALENVPNHRFEERSLCLALTA